MDAHLAVPYVDLAREHAALRTPLLEAVGRVLDHGGFILGPEVAAFEERFARLSGARFAISVANGTDALCLALRGLGIGPGDEVITAPNSFLASASSIALVGATPVFVDVAADGNLDPERIEAALSTRSRALLPVHLTGRPAAMERIQEIAARHQLDVIEDAAQAVGAERGGRRVGSFGDAACFSLHPLKNLAACGDGGVITTQDAALADWLVRARNHGLRSRDECALWSVNSRLDTLHAAMLLVKLEHLETWTKARREHAAFYHDALADVVEVPREAPGETCVYHTYVIQSDDRDALRARLAQRGVETRIHYPIPIHRQPAAAGLGLPEGAFPVAERQAGRILSLPVFPTLTSTEREHVARCVRDFHAAGRR
ncbi:MAG: DegT/DnrJ/EryC1/StrS family aminotransferase [Myxococcota bacterium]